MKKCTICNIFKPYSDFNNQKKKNGNPGLTSRCKNCRRIDSQNKKEKINEAKRRWLETPQGKESQKKSTEKNKEKRKIRRAQRDIERKEQIMSENPDLWENIKNKNKDLQLRINFGITLKDYNMKLLEQSNCCAICKKHYSEFKKALSVDHNHETGIIRGLLCGPCNLGLGIFKESEELLDEAGLYIKKWNNKEKNDEVSNVIPIKNRSSC